MKRFETIPTLDMVTCTRGATGGSHKRSNEETMFSPRRLMLIVPALVAASLVFGSPASADEQDCNWYGVESAKQQQENVDKACNLTGERWTADVKAEVTWCESVSPEEWLQVVKDRKKELDGCGG